MADVNIPVVIMAQVKCLSLAFHLLNVTYQYIIIKKIWNVSRARWKLGSKVTLGLITSNKFRLRKITDYHLLFVLPISVDVEDKRLLSPDAWENGPCCISVFYFFPIFCSIQAHATYRQIRCQRCTASPILQTEGKVLTCSIRW